MAFFKRCKGLNLDTEFGKCNNVCIKGEPYCTDCFIIKAKKVISYYENSDNWNLRHSAFDEEIWQGDGGEVAKKFKKGLL